MQKKILILPISAGLAHIIRSIALAEELSKKHDVTIEIHEKKLPLINPPKNIHILISNEADCDNITKLFQTYLKGNNVKEIIDRYLSMIDKINPDLVITDMNPAGLLAAYIRKKKQVMVNNSELLPYSKGIPGWFSRSMTIPQKMIAWPIEVFLDFWKKFFIGSAINYVRLYGVKPPTVDELIRSITIILPEVREYIPLKKYPPSVHFVNPIVHNRAEARDRKLEKELRLRSKGKKTIYFTFGGTGFGKKLLLKTVGLLLKEKYFVILAAGNIIDPEEVKIKSENLFIRKFIPGFSACKIADIVLSHGSYGTITQALHWGKPIVCVPFNLDHIFHGLKIRELGIGRSLITLKPHHFIMDMRKTQQMGENFDPVKIVEAVKESLENKEYLNNAVYFSRYFQKLDGVRNAVKIITSLIN